MKINVRTSLAGLLAAIVALATTNAQASNLLVYNTNNSGAGSLRQAINDSNAGAGNTIIFSNVVTGTITLTTGELLISTNVTIIGPGANVLAVSGNNASRVFHITSSVVTISGLTIRNGVAVDAGVGGIYNDHSTLTVSNCTVTANSASGSGGGGIYNDGGFGGTGSVQIVNSTLSRNSATSQIGLGGGIYNYGGNFGFANLTVIASTLSSNSTGGTGSGGGILNDSATSTVMASTFSGNSAGYHGGGIASESATLEIGDTILNAGASGENIYNYSGGSVTSRGYNLSSDSGGGVLAAIGDQINTDAMLGPLQDNGGPTPTMMPMAGSPAIDQGKRNAVASLPSSTDQRGRCRTYDDPGVPNAIGGTGDGTDIGAVEVSPAHSTVVTTTSDNGISLRWCICEAQAGETVTFGITGTVTLTSGELLVDKNATILGPTAAGVTVSGNNATGIFHVKSGGALNISWLTLANGNAFTGGGINNETGCTLTLSNSTITGCTSSSGGGGIANNGTVTVVNCTFYGNQSNGGGGLYNFAGTLNIFNSSIASNKATSTQGGGGIYNFSTAGSTANIRSSIVASNTAAGGGPDVQATTVHPFTSQGYNLIGNATGANGINAPFDQTSVDPKLGPLTDNGGPTKTMALRVGSPAIDAGNSFGLATDQRGQPWYDNPNVANASVDGADIGAYEATELRIVNAQKTGNHLRLDFINWLGTNYEVQSRSDLSSGSWGSLAGSTPGNGGIASTTVSNAFGVPKQFYRIHPVP